MDADVIEVRSPERYIVATVHGGLDGDDPLDPSMRGNAWLIAQAPAMLDALKSFCGDHESTGFACAGLNAAYQHAMRVIAEAEGREP